VGNGTFLANEYDSVFQGGSYQYRPYPAFPFNALKYSKIPDINGRPLIYGNQEFIQNLVDYMLGDNSVLDIRSRQIELRQLDQRKMMDEGNFIRYINLLIPFLLIALLGGVIFFLRKKKYQ
jgi:ABC-type uncharacterized transport system involved in gliding motility auxiliary subunit